MPFNKLLLVAVIIFLSCESDSTDQVGTTGQGGSMTRFAISNNYMYLVDDLTIKVFDISEKNVFRQVNEINAGFGLETIVARGEYLYLGSRDAMYIYSIADPQTPSFIFRYAHIVSCDPVVVQGNRAYVTLRSESGCNRGVNALEIIDIGDPYHPTLIRNYPMQSPHGLGIDGNLLFICEGEFGVKLYDVSDERNIRLITQHSNIYAYDVIAKAGVATVTGEDGIFQYHYAPAEDALPLLSKIPVERIND